MRNQLPRTTIIGNLTADPKLYGEDTDTPRAVFTIAVNYGWDAEEKKFKYNAFFQITYFGDAGVNFANSYSKGSRVIALCSLGNHTKEAYDEDGDTFNQTLITLNADVAGASNEFSEIEVAEAPAKKPKKKAAKSKRPSPKDEEPEEDEEEYEEDDADDEEEVEEEEERPKKKAASSTKKAPARRAPARRAPARRKAA